VELASSQCAACGRLTRDPDDVTVVRFLAGEATITASLCEGCHPTGGLQRPGAVVGAGYS
jgi:hypothetical protein